MSSLEAFWPIFEELESRATELPDPDPLYPFGTNGDDEINPPSQGVSENFFGGGGNDIIYGLGGPDTIQGDSISFRDRKIVSNWNMFRYGNDIIFGEDGNRDGDLFDSPLGASSIGDDDNIFADLGNDWVFGEAGNDQIWGGPRRGDFAAVYKQGIRDRDRVYGGVGDDFIVGGYDDDIMVGGKGNDIVIGSTQRGGDHAWDGVDILWGDDEGGNGSTGADLFVLGERGERFYDDNVAMSQGWLQFALIKDFNPVVDQIQLAALTVPPIGSQPRYVFDYMPPQNPGSPSFAPDELGAHAPIRCVNGCTLDPHAQGTAIYYYSGITPHAFELIAFVEGVTPQTLTSGNAIVYS
jgi:hypothetical protein